MLGDSFLKVPNLPEGRISLALVDFRITKNMEKTLLNRGIKVIKTYPNKNLYSAVSGHPDMILHHLGGNRIIISPEADFDFVKKLNEEGFEIIFGEKKISDLYPGDIPYNAARLGDFAVCSVKNTDRVLLEELKKSKIKIIDVKQGYAKCSLSVVDKCAAITSDKGIYKVLINEGLDCLLIRPGFINLFDMNYGFIGGASGLISNNELAFFGDIGIHPDFNEIIKFLDKYGKKPINLGKNIPMDLGTLIPLKEYSIV